MFIVFTCTLRSLDIHTPVNMINLSIPDLFDLFDLMPFNKTFAITVFQNGEEAQLLVSRVWQMQSLTAEWHLAAS